MASQDSRASGLASRSQLRRGAAAAARPPPDRDAIGGRPHARRSRRARHSTRPIGVTVLSCGGGSTPPHRRRALSAAHVRHAGGDRALRRSRRRKRVTEALRRSSRRTGSGRMRRPSAGGCGCRRGRESTRQTWTTGCFPIGTKLWKEFSRDGSARNPPRRALRRGAGGLLDGGVRLERRADDGDAGRRRRDDINGTTHDAPRRRSAAPATAAKPGACWGSRPCSCRAPADDGRVGPALADLSRTGLLSVPPPAAAARPPSRFPATPRRSPRSVTCTPIAATATTRTARRGPTPRWCCAVATEEHDAANVRPVPVAGRRALQYWRGGAITLRVAPGAPDASAIVARMSARGYGSDAVARHRRRRPDGLAHVRAWIAALPPSIAATLSADDLLLSPNRQTTRFLAYEAGSGKFESFQPRPRRALP